MTKRKKPPVKPKMRPRWDGHALWLGDRLVKRLDSPSIAQRCILAAFQEENWPTRIDDPLPRSERARQDPKDRLRNVVRNLNGCQKDARIRFRSDGTGEGICWEVG